MQISIATMESGIEAIQKTKIKPGVVAHAYNPSTLRGQDRQITWDREFETSLTNMKKPYLY